MIVKTFIVVGKVLPEKKGAERKRPDNRARIAVHGRNLKNNQFWREGSIPFTTYIKVK
jgi:hypothetical protein